jgi:PIN domain nuclease of toxin-antitoxin system
LIVIDTSVAVGFLRGDPRSVSRLESEQKLTDSFGISAVSLFELLNPIYHGKLDHRRM